MPKFEWPYRVLEVKNNNLIFGKRGRKVIVSVHKVRIYHPRNYETSSYDSINETIYEGKGSSNWSNRLNSEKSRRFRKPSGNENKSCKSDKRNTGLEDLRIKCSKAVESMVPHELKRGAPSSISSRSHKHMRKDTNKHPTQEPEVFPGTSNQRQMRRFSPPKEESSREARVESGKARETRTKDSGGHSAAEGRPV
ncbi:uncharacterized protein TNCV_3260271 [Trichonephila clavipes]|nr:uncharacterized protein TNCV_3260271 [Trichonephila clavipes]